jgi:hypothetical protein
VVLYVAAETLGGKNGPQLPRVEPVGTFHQAVALPRHGLYGIAKIAQGLYLLPDGIAAHSEAAGQLGSGNIPSLSCQKLLDQGLTHRSLLTLPRSYAGGRNCIRYDDFVKLCPSTHASSYNVEGGSQRHDTAIFQSEGS